MTVALNGFELAKSVGNNHDTFADARVELQKAMLAVIATQLKSKALNLQRITEVRNALGGDAFALILGHLKKQPLGAIVSKIDQHNSDQKGASEDWSRKQIIALASGDITPVQRPPQPPAKKAAAKTKSKASRSVTEENFYPKSMTTAVGSRKK